MSVFILNTGIVSSIGLNTSENLASLRQSKHGLSYPEFLLTKINVPVGEIKLSNEDLNKKLNLSAILPRTALLGMIAAEEAWQPFAGKTEGLRIAFISANTVGGMDLTEQYFPNYFNQQEMGKNDFVKNHACGAITQLTLEHLNIDAWSTTISTACSSSANTLMLAARLIKHNQFDLVIAGGADALSKFTLNGFNALKIVDNELCKPFNEDRKGLNLGEGAAYLVMGNEKATEKLKATPIAILTGYANANDAHHQTASSPDGRGNKLAMLQAMKLANIEPKDIDYINLHGTGTNNNDDAEGTAISHIFGETPPISSSTKTFTGHTLGASGALESVFSVLAIQHQSAWPHLRLIHPIEKFSWKPNTDLLNLPVNNVLSNSFGFGGNCTSLIFSKP